MTDKQRSYAILNFKTDYTDLFEVKSGPDLKEGKLGSCPGPPQLGGGLHRNSKKIIT